ncbi:hypothetical protein GA0070612_2800 [Micromonospora chokoriensis]|uniref:SH3 domain-containing protein n=1 Tax=Micromonospora chokoriensis TaxID=356851 RepID=A0A1C4WSS5_9ACTN|nr:hypothetical protein GA0070612_2800 [Micromonospora chokoriensis]
MQFQTGIRQSAVVALAIATLLLASGAPGHAAEPNRSVAAAAASCAVTPKSGMGNINIRTGPGTNHSTDGILRSGTWASSACSNVSGGSYSACGGGNKWIVVHPDCLGCYGYVAYSCVRLVRDV